MLVMLRCVSAVLGGIAAASVPRISVHQSHRSCAPSWGRTILTKIGELLSPSFLPGAITHIVAFSALSGASWSHGMEPRLNLWPLQQGISFCRESWASRRINEMRVRQSTCNFQMYFSFWAVRSAEMLEMTNRSNFDSQMLGFTNAGESSNGHSLGQPATRTKRTFPCWRLLPTAACSEETTWCMAVWW